MPNNNRVFIETIKEILKGYLNPNELQIVRLKLSSLSSKPKDDFGLSELDNEQKKLLLQRLEKLQEARQEEADRENKDFADKCVVSGTILARPFTEAEDTISEEYLKQIIADIQSPSNMEGVPVADAPATSVKLDQGDHRDCCFKIPDVLLNFYRRVHGR